MASNIDTIKQSILEAIQRDDFTASEITSIYQAGDIVTAITAILHDRRISDKADTVNLSESELQNIYLLARTIITRDMISRKEKDTTRKKTNSKTNPLISETTIESMYRLRPVY
jgi:coenzyme F420-reducing hydrogenase beta subunit